MEKLLVSDLEGKVYKERVLEFLLDILLVELYPVGKYILVLVSGKVTLLA
jgi:hypothetical protein